MMNYSKIYTRLLKLSNLALLFSIVLFLWLKLANNTIYFADTNVYFATAQAILHGKILYKDVFFTNLPLFPYISALYSVLFQGNLLAFGFTGDIEAALASILVYYIVIKKTDNATFSLLSALLFLFSSNTLTNATGQVGMFTVIFFYILATFLIYTNSDLSLLKINDYQQIIAAIKKDNPPYIYGTTFVTTAVSASTGIPLMNDLTDTDDGLFTTGVLNSTKLTQDAIRKKADVLVWGAQYISQGQLKKDILNVAVNKNMLYKKCKLVNTYPFHGPYYINELFLFRCGSG